MNPLKWTKCIVILNIIFFNSCTFFKSEKDHALFIENKLMEIYNQKGIYQPHINPSNYEEFSGYKFIDYFKSKRTGNGTFLTKLNLYSVKFNYESCNLPYPGMPGYVYRDRYGSRVKNILKEPLGQLEIRTDYDGEVIYLINYQLVNRSDYDDDESKWKVLSKLNLKCR